MKDALELPKILTSGNFLPKDIQISINESNRKIDLEIESQLENIWQGKIKKAQELSKNCYNGISYRLNNIRESDEK